MSLLHSPVVLMKRPIFQRICIGFCLLALAACGGKALGFEPSGRSIQTEYGYNVRTIPASERRTAPPFSGETIDGSPLDSASLGSSVVVLNFWASDCGPCRKEQPILQSLSGRYENRGVRFVGVNAEPSKVNARTFLAEFGVTYPSIFDPYFEIAYKFRVFFLPATYVLDGRRRVAAIIFGATTHEQQLVRILDMLDAEPAA
jgi:thiol-disulfide isomerase/thioredoxin